jgi:hypothetical protein
MSCSRRTPLHVMWKFGPGILSVITSPAGSNCLTHLATQNRYDDKITYSILYRYYKIGILPSEMYDTHIDKIVHLTASCVSNILTW